MDIDPNDIKQTRSLPKAVYSSNLPHLNSWVEELLALTDKKSQVKTAPTTEHLAQSMQRYDSIFRELLRQNFMFNEPITKLFAKTWIGTIKLLDYMIKSYHRYVKHTSTLQSTSERLMLDQQKQRAELKILQEENELQRTALRAKVRILESDIEAVRSSNRDIERENTKLRNIIDVYIKSSELNENTWDFLDEDRANGTMMKESVYKRMNSVDSAKKKFEVLSRLEVESNEVLSSVLTEEDRQKLILEELKLLVIKNQELFEAVYLQSKRDEGSKHLRTANIAIQVDEKQNFGVVSELMPSPRDEAYLAAPIIAPGVLSFKGREIPYQIRKYMRTFTKVLRIPPAAWVCQQIMAVYQDKMQTDEENNRRGYIKNTLGEQVYLYYRKVYGLDSIADLQVSQFIAACEVYLNSLPRVDLFASQIGLFERDTPPSMDSRDTDFILIVLKEIQVINEQVALETDNKDTKNRPGSKGGKRKNLLTDILRASAITVANKIFDRLNPGAVQHDFMIKLKSMQGSDKLNRYIDIDKFIDVLIEPWHAVRQMWEEHANFIFEQHCNVYKVLSEVHFADDQGGKDRDTILMQLQKTSTADCMRRPMRMIATVSAGAVASKSSGAGDKDDHFEGGADKGKAGRGDHKGSSSSSADNSFRPPPSGSVNPNKEPVCEVMNRNIFYKVMEMLVPGIKSSEIERMFDEAVEHAYKHVLRKLELMWYQVNLDGGGGGDSEHGGNHSCYYINLKAMSTQWKRPYRAHTFKAEDLEAISFVATIVNNDTFLSSPFLSLMHIAPKDLWPNADMFLKDFEKKKGKHLPSK